MLQFTNYSCYSIEVTQVARCGHLYCKWYTIKGFLHNTIKGFTHETIIVCAQLLKTGCEYCAGLKTSACILPESRHSYTCVNFVWNVAHMSY